MRDVARIKAADDADREAENRNRRQMVDGARLDEHRRLHKQAWRERVNHSTTTATARLIDRLKAESSALSGVVDSEADIRARLTNIVDALTSMKATLDLEVRASVTRENEAARAAA